MHRVKIGWPLTQIANHIIRAIKYTIRYYIIDNTHAWIGNAYQNIYAS